MSLPRKLVYVAAPFASFEVGDVIFSEETNTRRAEVLALAAVRIGHAPICVHSGLLRGALGNDLSPTDRAVGLEVDLALCAAVARSGGELWLLLRPDGLVSSGCAVEVEEFERIAGRMPSRVRRGSWEDWRPTLLAGGLGDTYMELAVEVCRAL